MAQLIIPNTGYSMFKNNNYSNPDAVENVIRYITRTRQDEQKMNDIVAYGGAGVGYYLSVEDIIQQFQYVQKTYNIASRGGRRIYHEVFNLFDEEMDAIKYDLNVLWKIGMECCQEYFKMGHQAIFAVHCERGKRFHFHFVVNAINFLTGMKWHSYFYDLGCREYVFARILYKHMAQTRKCIYPFYCCSKNVRMPENSSLEVG